MTNTIKLKAKIYATEEIVVFYVKDFSQHLQFTFCIINSSLIPTLIIL